MSVGPRSQDVILRATVDLLAECGLVGMTVDAVAARAGVGKATIYRHWGSRARLIADAVGSTVTPIVPPDTGSLTDDLTFLLSALVDRLRTDMGRLLPSVIDASERDEELAELHRAHVRDRRDALRVVVGKAVARGELDPAVDVDLMIDLLIGPLFYRRLVSRRALRRADAGRLVDVVVAAFEVGAGRAERPVAR